MITWCIYAAVFAILGYVSKWWVAMRVREPWVHQSDLNSLNAHEVTFVSG